MGADKHLDMKVRFSLAAWEGLTLNILSDKPLHAVGCRYLFPLESHKHGRHMASNREA